MRTDPKPADAWWDAAQHEWVHGEKDAEGRLVGEVRYWDVDGFLISTAEHVADKPHGIARRYYRTGEIAQDTRYVAGLIHGERRYLRSADPAVVADGQLGRLSPDIATHVCVYEQGDLIGQLYFRADGTEVSSNNDVVPPRPAGVPPTAFTIPGQGWFWHRGAGETGQEWIESREYYDSGVLRRERDHRTGTERGYHDNGVLSAQGQRATGASHHLIGTWRYYDREGRPRLVATYDGESHGLRETYRVWHRDGMTREGTVARGVEVGEWIVRDAQGEVLATWDLGPLMKAELIDHAVCADDLDDGELEPRDRSLTAMIVRARRAGRDLEQLAFDGPAWMGIGEDGAEVRLDHRGTSSSELFAQVHALRWGPPDAALLADIATSLFRGNRKQAALDVADASLAVAADPEVARARASYLRALGRSDEADVAVARPDKLDARALELLAEIRANPDDDAPRLVFADHVAAQFPEHAAVIVAQCHCRANQALVDAFTATLPAWLRDTSKVDRGFFEHIRFVEAKHFVTGDPDVLYRVAPTSQYIDLSSASDHIAELVTMPALRRYRELYFSDSYFWNIHIEQLASCPYFDQLEHLSLYNCGLDDSDLETLAQSTAFPKLTGLDLTNGREGQDYTLDGLRALASAPFAATLRELSVQRRWLGDGLVEVLALFPALESVDVSHNSLSSAAQRALTARYGEGVRFD